MRLDLCLSNEQLYSGVEVQRLAGKLTLVTRPAEAIPVIVANLQKIVVDRDEVTMTGAMSIWVYLVVFHYLHGKTRRVYYEDGMGNRVLVMAHG